MNRRLVLAVGALVAAAVLSSCSSVNRPAASVNGHDISMSRYESIADAYRTFLNANAEVQGTPDSQVTTIPVGQLDGGNARGILSAAIETELRLQDLAAKGVTITDADRKAQEQTFIDSSKQQWDVAPQPLKDFLIERQAVRVAFEKAAAPPAADLQASYEQGIQASGVVCLSHILLKTEDEADKVLARLQAGEDFATVAKSDSIDTTSGADGGALLDSNGSPCTDGTTFATGYDPDFVKGALAAEVGVPTKPVKTQFGYHIILVRPFSEVSDAIVGAAASAASSKRETELFGTAKISVSPAIGTWDPGSDSVVALGTNTEPNPATTAPATTAAAG